MLIGIVAISRTFAIGKNGKLPWHYPADLRFFKETTTGNAVVMGSTTWRTIGKPLPNRLNVVLTRSGAIDTPPEVMRLENEREVIDLAGLLLKDVYIIGGAKTYEAFYEKIDKWVVTDVPITVEDADTYMPRDFLDGFEVVDTRDLGQGLRVRMLGKKASHRSAERAR